MRLMSLSCKSPHFFLAGALLCNTIKLTTSCCAARTLLKLSEKFNKPS